MNPAEYNTAKAKSCANDARDWIDRMQTNRIETKALADLAEAVHDLVLALEFMERRYQALREEQMPED